MSIPLESTERNRQSSDDMPILDLARMRWLFLGDFPEYYRELFSQTLPGRQLPLLDHNADIRVQIKMPHLP